MGRLELPTGIHLDSNSLWIGVINLGWRMSPFREGIKRFLSCAHGIESSMRCNGVDTHREVGDPDKQGVTKGAKSRPHRDIGLPMS